MTYSSVVLADTPIRYYRLDESSGTTATDLGSQGRNGTLFGGLTLSQHGLIAADSDTAYLFGGVNGRISLPTTGLPTTGPWSLEFWARVGATPSSWGSAIGLGSGTNYIEFGYRPSGAWTILAGTSGNITAGATINGFAIYHVAATYDGGTLTLYVNGASAGTLSLSSYSIIYGSANIGTAFDGSDAFAGTLDEVAFYASTLSASQISSHFATGVSSAIRANPYGSCEFSNSNPNYTGDLLSQKPAIAALLNAGASTLRGQTSWYGIEKAVQTTSTTPINAPGVATITLASKPANFIVGAQVLVDNIDSGVQETVPILATGTNTITANFTKAHTGTFYPHSSGTLYPVAVIPLAGDTPSNCGSPPRVQAYDWSVVDDLVTMSQSNGLLIDFVIQNAPDWHTMPLVCNSNATVPDNAAVPAFLTALLSRYPAGSFYAIEANNEGYSACTSLSMFQTQVLPLLQTVRSLINQYSPTTLVGAPALIDNNAANIHAWYTDFYAAGCAQYIDYLQYHYYNGTAGPNQPNAGDDTFTQAWQDIAAISAAHGDNGRPIQITEVGWGGISDALYASYISQVLNSAEASAVVRKVLVFTIVGLMPPSGQAYTAWENFITQYPQWITNPVTTQRRDNIVSTKRRG